MIKCDIIIPVYNAYDCVKSCLDSIIENTDLTKYRVICINDKSSDERIDGLLDEYTKKSSAIIKLTNEENKGFVGTVNKGMKYSKSDVLLLNSDTEVTPRWLDRIIETAYSENGIGTVTPLSNNATLVSAPVGLQRNELPSNMSLNEYGNLVEKCAYNENMILPTAHGFCMFIKREVLNDVGYFDEETFGKGYGEETDFSFRCLDYGYKHVLCDSVIIYHKEKQSFSEQRKELVATHEKIIMNRYPLYQNRVYSWCEKFPISHICKNLEYNISLYNRKNILIIIHDWTNILDNVGGTTLHVRDIIFKLRKDFNFHVLSYENGIYKLYSYFKDNEDVLTLKAFETYEAIPRYNRNYKQMLIDIIDGFGIDYIHVHHMIHHYFDIGEVIKERRIKSTISVHDLYPICPTINMLYKMEKFCDTEKEKKCAECLKNKIGIRNDIIKLWRKQWNSFFSVFDNIIVPSENTKNLLKKYYNKYNFKVIEHGIDLKKQEAIKKNDVKEINIAFVGVAAKHKGANIFLEMINSSKKNNFRFHLFGTSEVEALKKNKKNYIYHGYYKREELSKLLKENKIDIVCSLSICPETYSYTLTEIIASGVPVLALDIGAIAERIRENNFGWIIDIPKNGRTVIEKLNNIFSNLNDYNDKIDSINNYKLRNTQDMVNDYKKLYDVSLKEYDYKILRKIIKNNYKESVSINNDEYYRIVNSLKWRIVSKIHPPEIVKKIVRKIIG